jgi:hypothetical protein
MALWEVSPSVPLSHYLSLTLFLSLSLPLSLSLSLSLSQSLILLSLIFSPGCPITSSSSVIAVPIEVT